MATIVTRAGKGSPLTHTEVDANFTNLNTDKIESGNTVAALTIQSATITGGTVNNTSIGGSTPAAGTFTTLTATGQTSLGGAAGSESLRVITPTGGGGNYWQLEGSNGDVAARFLGSSSNIGATFVTRGSGNYNFATGTSTSTVQARISHTASAVNYVQVTGASTTTANGVIVSAQGSDTNLPLSIQSKGTGYINLESNRANYIRVLGATTTLTPQFRSIGTDTNVPLSIYSQGTGAINLAPGSSGVNISNGGTVTAITVSSRGSGYTSIPTVAITAPTTAGGVQATATVALNVSTMTLGSGGTGYTVNDVLTLSGITGTAPTVRVDTVSGGVITAFTITGFGGGNVLAPIPSNPIGVTGGTGSGATFNVNWNIGSFTITNAGSGYVEQPTVSFSGGGGSGAAAIAVVGSTAIIKSLSSSLNLNAASSSTTPVLRLDSVGNPANAVFIYNNSTGNSPVVRALGSDTNISFALSSQGTGNINFHTNALAQEQFRVAHTSSAVNYVQVTGASTGNAVNISAQGSDSNVRLVLRSKAAEGIQFEAGNNARQVFITAVNNAVNYLTLSGSIANNAVPITVAGTDTNIDLNLTTKGTGALNVIANGATQFKVGETAITSAVNYVSIFGGATGVAPRLLVRGSDTNINLLYSTKGSGEHVFRTNETNNDQFRITHTASAVNYVQVTGAATTGTPIISAQGSDTNIALLLQAKGSGTAELRSVSGNSVLSTDGGFSAIRAIPRATSGDTFLDVQRNVGFVDLIAGSGVTDGDIRLTPKGAGLVRFGTYTAGAPTATGYISIKAADGTTYKVLVST